MPLVYPKYNSVLIFCITPILLHNVVTVMWPVVFRIIAHSDTGCVYGGSAVGKKGEDML